MTAPIGGNSFTPPSIELDSMPSATEEGPFIQVRLSEYEKLQNEAASQIKALDAKDAIIQLQSTSIDRVTRSNEQQREQIEQKTNEIAGLKTAVARAQESFHLLQRRFNAFQQAPAQQAANPPGQQTTTQGSFFQRAWNRIRAAMPNPTVIKGCICLTLSPLAWYFPELGVPIVLFSSGILLLL